MQLLRVFFAFIRTVIAGMRSIVISYGKFLETTRVKSKPARKAHTAVSPKRKPRTKVKP